MKFDFSTEMLEPRRLLSVAIWIRVSERMGSF